MKRIIVISTLVVALFVATLGHAAKPQSKPEKLSKQQLSSLITAAKSPSDHRRIANYYTSLAQDDLAQLKMHQEMAEQFKANPLTRLFKVREWNGQPLPVSCRIAQSQR